MDRDSDQPSGGHYRAFLLARLAEVADAQQRLHSLEQAMAAQGLDDEQMLQNNEINRRSLQALRKQIEEELAAIESDEL